VPKSYRRKRGSGYQEWHFDRRCPKVPEEDYEIAYSEPQTGKLCEHCKRLAKRKSIVQW
jgi:hypothetical protein